MPDRPAPPAASTPAKPAAPRRDPFGDRRFDARPDRLDLRDLTWQAPLKSLPARWPAVGDLERFLPAYIGAGLVRDQGADGACTGFGLAAVVNYLLFMRALESGKGEGFAAVSPKMLYELARRYDEWRGEDYEGSSCRGALKGWHKHGVCAEALWPYRGRRVVRPKEGWAEDALGRPLGVYYRIDIRSVVDLQAAIVQIGAVFVSAQVHDGWSSVPRVATPPMSHDDAALPTIPPPTDGKRGGHAFALVGFNDRGFVVQNSWGEAWGARGFAVLRYEDWTRHASDAWAVALGVPQDRAASAERRAAIRWPSAKGRSLAFRDASARQAGNPQDDPWPEDRRFEHPANEPWPTARAYEHTLITGNNGHVQVTDFEAGVDGDVAAFVDGIACTRPAAWFTDPARAAQPARLAIYVHGGLNGQDESIERIRVMGPVFAANGIYPLFLTWRTGPVETLLGIVRDKAAEWIGLDPDGLRSAGWLDAIADKRDRAIELAANKAAKGLWTEMRGNARLSARPGRGLALLARSITKLRAALGAQPLELHLVGHSAGSIVLGHLLGQLEPGTAAKPAVAGCTLYAAACSARFAVDTYLAAGDTVLPLPSLHLHHLTDAQEKDDDLLKFGPVTLYGKSLLYLVSRALDDVRKQPLLGMERAFDPAFLGNDDQWAASEHAALRTLQARVPPANRHPVPHPVVRVDWRGKTVQARHGTFDNDIDGLTATLVRIRGGQPLVVPVEWLDG
jgi:hypothetical protein